MNHAGDLRSAVSAGLETRAECSGWEAGAERESRRDSPTWVGRSETDIVLGWARGTDQSFQMSAVRAATSGSGGSGALGTASYQNVAHDQSS